MLLEGTRPLHISEEGPSTFGMTNADIAMNYTLMPKFSMKVTLLHSVHPFVRLSRVHDTIIVPPANLEVQIGMFFALRSYCTWAVLFVQRFHLVVDIPQ